MNRVTDISLWHFLLASQYGPSYQSNLRLSDSPVHHVGSTSDSSVLWF